MDRRIHVPLYVLVILVFTSFAGPALSVMLSLRLGGQAVAEMREEDREQTCTEHGAVITVLRDAPVLAPAGQGLLTTYEALYAKNRCAEDPPGR